MVILTGQNMNKTERGMGFASNRQIPKMRVTEIEKGLFSASIVRDVHSPPISDEDRQYFLNNTRSNSERLFYDRIIAEINKEFLLRKDSDNSL